MLPPDNPHYGSDLDGGDRGDATPPTTVPSAGSWCQGRAKFDDVCFARLDTRPSRAPRDRPREETSDSAVAKKEMTLTLQPGKPANHCHERAVGISRSEANQADPGGEGAAEAQGQTAEQPAETERRGERREHRTARHDPPGDVEAMALPGLRPAIRTLRGGARDREARGRRRGRAVRLTSCRSEGSRDGRASG